MRAPVDTEHRGTIARRTGELWARADGGGAIGCTTGSARRFVRPSDPGSADERTDGWTEGPMGERRGVDRSRGSRSAGGARALELHRG